MWKAGRLRTPVDDAARPYATVDHHVSAILAKLDVRSRSEAAAKAADLSRLTDTR